jgi:hypothetical protein
VHSEKSWTSVSDCSPVLSSCNLGPLYTTVVIQLIRHLSEHCRFRRVHVSITQSEIRYVPILK